MTTSNTNASEEARLTRGEAMQAYGIGYAQMHQITRLLILEAAQQESAGVAAQQLRRIAGFRAWTPTRVHDVLTAGSIYSLGRAEDVIELRHALHEDRHALLSVLASMKSFPCGDELRSRASAVFAGIRAVEDQAEALLPSLAEAMRSQLAVGMPAPDHEHIKLRVDTITMEGDEGPEDGFAIRRDLDAEPDDDTVANGIDEL